MRRLNIILTNAAMRNGNRGCVALSVSAMFIIDKILTKHNIPYTFILPNSGHINYGEYTVDLGDRKITYQAVRNYETDGLKNKVKNIVRHTQYKQSAKLYDEADYILDLGQGDSFSDIYGLKRFNRIYDSHRKAIRHKAKFCLMPQTIGPFDDTNVRSRATASIDYASLVFARDKQSYDSVRQLLPSKELFEAIDVAFCLPYHKEEQSKDFIHVGLNVSALLWNGGYTRTNQFGLKEDYKDVINAIIDYFLAQPAVKLHLIPHVVEGERGIENDYEVAYDIMRSRNSENLVLAPFFLDPIVAKGYIAGMDFFMGARMHSTIAAFSSGVPVMPMAYSRKFNGLFMDTLDYSAVVDLKRHTLRETIDAIADAYEHRAELSNIISQRNSGVVKERLDMLERKLSEFFGL